MSCIHVGIGVKLRTFDYIKKNGFYTIFDDSEKL